MSSILQTASQFVNQSCYQDLYAGYGSIDIYNRQAAVESSTSTDRHIANSSRHTLDFDSPLSSFSSDIGHMSENPWNGMLNQTRSTIGVQEYMECECLMKYHCETIQSWLYLRGACTMGLPCL